jgi:hypothetical protein
MTTTNFMKADYSLSGLIEQIDMGSIGLPDIQRPFVWKNTKVRNLFDSMYRGFPIGYLLFWETGGSAKNGQIGVEKKQLVPDLLIVDGQQRLTAIYAVVTGTPVYRDNYAAEAIEIAFNPLQEQFEVADAATRRDHSYITNISEIWQQDSDIFQVVENYLDELGKVREVGTAEKKQVQQAISRLSNLLYYPFTALQLSANLDEEEVSEIFVRINSEGKKLNQADFILTLMSVFWDEGRKELEHFCKGSRSPASKGASPYNQFIAPDPDQLLRVSIGLGFRRARLKTVYSILRGKDLQSESFDESRRQRQFGVLQDAQQRTLNLTYWHDFHKVLIRAGYRSNKMISSENSLIFAYILYLLGRTEYGVDDQTLRQATAQWFFMSSLTGRYTSSPESAMEFDLRRFRDLETAEQFIATLRQVCNDTLTPDYWSITLPNELATSAARSPSMFAYYAALNLLGARVLYSKHTVTELMDPAVQGTKSSLERHHLFPKAYLVKIGVTETRMTNQIANFTMLEWGDNSSISDRRPEDYVPEYEAQFSSKELERMYYWHSLPYGWYSMDYQTFLRHRRELMAKVIQDAYAELAAESMPGEAIEPSLPVESLVIEGESSGAEFKSTLRINLHNGEKDRRMELGVLKTIAAFLNMAGGQLVIGVADDGNPVGIEADGFASEDKFYLHFVNLVKERIGPQHMMYVHPRFEDYGEVRVFVAECQKAHQPVYVQDDKVERFYIRSGAATTELTARQMTEFIRQRF